MADAQSFDLEAAQRPPLRSLRGYEPIDPPEQVAARYGVAPEAIVKLDGNENPYGPSPRALEALAGGYAAHRYPDPEQRRLRDALAARHGVPAECIVAGAGADEIIDLVFRIFIDTGDRVVIASPTFGMYSFGAEVAGAQLVDVPRGADWSVDLDALAAACEGAKAVFLPSPNNPTGGLLPRGAADRLRASGAIVVIDEAYVEFASGHEGVHSGPPTLVGDAAREGGAPLIVLRTFSKWAGLAGLRVGYGVMPSRGRRAADGSASSPTASAPPPRWPRSPPSRTRRCSTSAPARSPGSASGWPAELRAGGWLEPAPSQANFLLCRLAFGSGAALREALARRGVFVRFFGHERLRDHVRISIGTPEDSERLLAALAEARAEVEGAAGEERRERACEAARGQGGRRPLPPPRRLCHRRVRGSLAGCRARLQRGERSRRRRNATPL